MLSPEKEEISNVRGKVEICKDQNEKITKRLAHVDDQFLRNRDTIVELETKIDQLKSSISAQQVRTPFIEKYSMIVKV